MLKTAKFEELNDMQKREAIEYATTRIPLEMMSDRPLEGEDYIEGIQELSEQRQEAVYDFNEAVQIISEAAEGRMHWQFEQWDECYLCLFDAYKRVIFCDAEYDDHWSSFLSQTAA
jgi:hypothetical protein